MEQGSTYVDRTTGQERVMPKIGEGMAMGPGGVYGALPGYAQGQASIEGAKAQATEEAKARLNPLPLGYVDSGTGRPVGGSTYDYLKPKQAQPAMTPELEAFIRADAAKNGIPNPVANFTGGSRFDLAKPSVMQGLGQLQSAAEAKAAEAKALQPIEAGNKINDAWLKTSYEPVISQGGAANDMLTNVAVARQSMRNMGGTGWGTEAKATGAGILAGLGIATKNAELYASNAQTFQSAAMTNLWTTLNAAKGPQTEGDADRAKQTFAQLKSTPQANEYILDLAEAKAQRDAMKASFYQNALPIAKEEGDLQKVDREWSKRVPSIFSMPSMTKWAKK
jgi:hypothetical protein